MPIWSLNRTTSQIPAIPNSSRRSLLQRAATTVVHGHTLKHPMGPTLLTRKLWWSVILVASMSSTTMWVLTSKTRIRHSDSRVQSMAARLSMKSRLSEKTQAMSDLSLHKTAQAASLWHGLGLIAHIQKGPCTSQEVQMMARLGMNLEWLTLAETSPQLLLLAEDRARVRFLYSDSTIAIASMFYGLTCMSQRATLGMYTYATRMTPEKRGVHGYRSIRRPMATNGIPIWW